MNATRVPRLLLLLVLTVLAACGELTVGGTGEVEVFATANAAGTTAYQGLLITEIRVFLLRDDTGQWVEMTDGVRDLTLDLRGVSERRAGVRFAPGGRYSRLRAVFQRVEANVTSGGGLTGIINVDLGVSGSLAVEREVVIELVSNRSVDLILDLNTTSWLATASPATRTVSATTFGNAVGVAVR